MRADAQRNRAKILAAAEEVFAAQGASASTEEVARRAGVAIGTVFRHFPTKYDLLAAIMKEVAARLAAEVEELAQQEDPAALFAFFSRLVEQASAHKTVVALLEVDLQMGPPLQQMRSAIAELLACAQQGGVIRPDVQLDEVMALLTATSHAALHSGWSQDLRERTLAIVFAGLRPS
ncbi:TetR/AcrR family transcriptional regulator [Actinocrispum wychmicini]|uniref:TetR family transcriptional regulator n=1 Tax=Actinocrispum wychmicini TaxID=1213861 RepID=A0A4R2J6J8_9PSEU|nr:TetR/AcrR family transcriptional regulator [Actinocrispum wychmicini]TCO53172.1 TetR family transcriptional regulator [Actinocrispum wychmicini]